MAGMLIAPAVAARQFTDRLWAVFLLAALVGALSGFLGNYLSVELPQWGGWNFSLPTGPMILLSASMICLLSLLLAPRGGLVSRLVRILRFRKQCAEDHILKSLWRRGESGKMTFHEVKKGQSLSQLQLKLLLWRMKNQGWIVASDRAHIALTQEGRLRAASIVRLHRLWEAYLVFLGQGAEKVHKSAEEMEHILTPELEKELTDLLGNPKKDPHAQPIPPKEET
jgi:manganese/zinc/iron transport system permease protein